MGRPSIPPEMLLQATLLQAFFSVCSERMLMEQINYNLLFRWFVGLEIDAAVWHPTVFTHEPRFLQQPAGCSACRRALEACRWVLLTLPTNIALGGRHTRCAPKICCQRYQGLGEERADKLRLSAHTRLAGFSRPSTF
jgi:hypothetical protein